MMRQGLPAATTFSFSASGWKCKSIAVPQVLRRSLTLGIPSQRLGTRQSLKACSRLAFALI